jgi:hypothetical protein
MIEKMVSKSNPAHIRPSGMVIAVGEKR